MNQASIDFLERNRFHYDILMRAGYLKQVDANFRETMLRIIQTEFNSGYLTNLWCGECVMEMVKYAYQEYDKKRAG